MENFSKMDIHSDTHGTKTVLFDSEWTPLILQYTWYIQEGNSGVLYARTTMFGIRVFMHQLILNARGRIIDHKNNDGLDNRRVNLRFVTNSMNVRNSKKKHISGIQKRLDGFRFRTTINKLKIHVIESKDLELVKYVKQLCFDKLDDLEKLVDSGCSPKDIRNFLKPHIRHYKTNHGGSDEQ